MKTRAQVAIFANTFPLGLTGDMSVNQANTKPRSSKPAVETVAKERRSWFSSARTLGPPSPLTHLHKHGRLPSCRGLPFLPARLLGSDHQPATAPLIRLPPAPGHPWDILSCRGGSTESHRQCQCVPGPGESGWPRRLPHPPCTFLACCQAWAKARGQQKNTQKNPPCGQHKERRARGPQDKGICVLPPSPLTSLCQHHEQTRKTETRREGPRWECPQPHLPGTQKGRLIYTVKAHI